MPSTLSYRLLNVFGFPGQTDSAWITQTAGALQQAKKSGDRNILLDAVKTPNLLEKLAGNSNKSPRPNSGEPEKNL